MSISVVTVSMVLVCPEKHYLLKSLIVKYKLKNNGGTHTINYTEDWEKKEKKN